MNKEILIVERNKPTLNILKTVLNDHHVEVLTDGRSVLKRLEEGGCPDLIIMDPDLPDQPDWQLVEQLSHHHAFSSIPLMVLSDGGEEETRSRVVAHGVMDYFFKPFNPESLARSVENIFVSRAMGPIY
jgi:DNA-binding response OmpR family regulator